MVPCGPQAHDIRRQHPAGIGLIVDQPVRGRPVKIIPFRMCFVANTPLRQADIIGFIRPLRIGAGVRDPGSAVGNCHIRLRHIKGVLIFLKFVGPHPDALHMRIIQHRSGEENRKFSSHEVPAIAYPVAAGIGHAGQINPKLCEFNQQLFFARTAGEFGEVQLQHNGGLADLYRKIAAVIRHMNIRMKRRAVPGGHMIHPRSRKVGFHVCERRGISNRRQTSQFRIVKLTHIEPGKFIGSAIRRAE
ncbi:MAG: hypothetical protein BWY83_03116 [bacterium ADurb.Bin478]|nr:MAG: hypothetical protein BWY83_03116 [bacterium ADurb.Bin478]